MSAPLLLHLDWSDWFDLFLRYLSLSLLAVGGAISTTPEMHRYLVGEQRWLTESQFGASISIAQAAPGPNVLFVALLGWNVGVNSGGMLTGLLGMSIAMLGMLLPSTTLTYMAARWSHQNRDLRGIRAFKQGMAPIVIGLLLSTGWIMASANHDPAKAWPLWLASGLTALIVWQTRIHLLWLLGAGALLGWYGLI